MKAIWKKYTYCKYLYKFRNNYSVSSYWGFIDADNICQYEVLEKTKRHIYWEANHYCRSIRTAPEKKQNKFDILYRREIKAEYGKGFQIRRKDKLPDPWDDYWSGSTKSWKKLKKKKKQWM